MSMYGQKSLFMDISIILITLTCEFRVHRAGSQLKSQADLIWLVIHGSIGYCRPKRCHGRSMRELLHFLDHPSLFDTNSLGSFPPIQPPPSIWQSLPLLNPTCPVSDSFHPLVTIFFQKKTIASTALPSLPSLVNIVASSDKARLQTGNTKAERQRTLVRVKLGHHSSNWLRENIFWRT